MLFCERSGMVRMFGAIVLFLMALSAVADETLLCDVLSKRESWLAKSEAAIPKLIRRTVKPVGEVEIVKDANSFQGWKAVPVGKARVWMNLTPGDSFAVDFGEHLVGRLSFRLAERERPMDAPCRLRFTFAEVPGELGEPIESYRGGLSRSWFQDETVNFDFAPMDYTLPRRYAFRYVKIEVVSCPREKPVIEWVKAVAETSADDQNLKPWTAPNQMSARLDRVACATLRDCMQTMLEDGPKRDRRLWLGDLRLQALVNYETYRNLDVVKRSLYLLAGTAKDSGLVGTDAYERPFPKKGDCRIYDYTALFPQTVYEYLDASGDRATAEDLWPLCKRQIELVLKQVGEDGLVQTTGDWWYFIDWDKGLDRRVPEQGVVIFGLQGLAKLARRLGYEDEICDIPVRIEKMRIAARDRFWNSERGVFTADKGNEVSCLGQAWMVIAGVPSAREAKRCLVAVLADASARKPRTPYGCHYLVEALYRSGLRTEADKALLRYWGAMVEKGADTFWEAFMPGDDMLSPYGDFRINSYCHAWSCGPAYFLRNPDFKALAE